MFWYMQLKMIKTPQGDTISNTLIFDDEHELELPSITINEDDVLEYNNVKYNLIHVFDCFNNGDGNCTYYYDLHEVEEPDIALVLDKYIDEYFE